MSALSRPLGLLAAVAGLVLAGPALADKSPSTIPAKFIIDDQAKMFSPDAIDRAKKIISENRGQVDREVHVETYEKLSDEDLKRFNEVKNDAAKREEFWREWTKKKTAGEHGVVIVVNRNPGHVSVFVGNEMAKTFKKEQRDELEKRFLSKLSEAAKSRKDGKPAADQQRLRDEALISGMEYTAKNLPASFGTRSVVEDRRHANDNAGAGVEGGGGGGGGGGWSIGGIICALIAFGLIAWLVVGVIRSLTGGGGMGGGYGGGGMMGGGGGFFPSLMGGLFGAAAGMWMYDQFFGGHSSAAYGGDGGAAGAGGAGSEEQITDTGNFSDENYSGGDYEGDAGGGDVGGGDFGGGDFGGGDFGGGDF